ELLRKEFVEAQGASTIFSQEFWVGGSQLRDQPSPRDGWSWVNNEGPIPGVNGGPRFANWTPGEPNDYGLTIGTEDNEENHLGIGLGGNSFQWNDEGNLSLILGYVVEYEPPPGCLALQSAVVQSAPISDCFASAWPSWSDNSVFLTTPLDVPGASTF